MRGAHNSEPGPAEGTAGLTAMEDRYFNLLMDRFDRIERRQDQSDDSRSRLHEKLNLTERAIEKLTGKVETLDASLASMSPTVQDYLMKTQQVAGAGKLGKALWWMGGLILAAASSAVSYVAGGGARG